MDFKIAKKRMIEEQLIPKGIHHQRVLEAMMKIPRHVFVDDALREQAYGDYPLAIGDGQTISQPYTVALMSQELDPQPGERILEIGTGCGYQTSVLAELGPTIFTIERIKKLAVMASGHLKTFGYKNITIRVGDGSKGWPEAAPFDGILMACGAPELPMPLFEQLREGGRLLIPIGGANQQKLMRILKINGKPIIQNLGDCRFVRLVGKHGWGEQRKIGSQFKKRSVV